MLAATILALTAVWNPDPAAQGFRLYYDQVPHEARCDDDRMPRRVVDVGDVTSFDLGELQLKPGKLYEIRLSAYTGDYETKLSTERLCINIDPKDKGPKHFEPPKAHGAGFGLGVSSAGPPKEEGKVENEKPKEKPEAPTTVAAPTQSELLARIDDSDSDDGWDSDIRVGSSGTGREWGDADAERVQPLLGSEGPSREPENRHGSSEPRILYTRTKRLHLHSEINPSKLGAGSRVLLRGNSLHDKRHDSAGVGPQQSGVRSDQDSKTKNAYWIAAAVAFLFIAALVVPWPHEKGGA